MIDHNHFICHFIFGGHLLNIPKGSTELTAYHRLSFCNCLNSIGLADEKKEGTIQMEMNGPFLFRLCFFFLKMKLQGHKFLDELYGAVNPQYGGVNT